MKNTMDDFQDMKTMWNELNLRISQLEEENRKLAKNVMSSNYKSVKEKLMKRYLTFMIIEFIFALIFPAYFLTNPLVIEKYRWVTAIYLFVFFALALGVDMYLYFNVKEMDIHNSTLGKISKIAKQNWRIHKLWIIIGLPIACGAILLYALALDANKYIIWGMMCGGLIGACIGIYHLMKFREGYRLLQSTDPED